MLGAASVPSTARHPRKASLGALLGIHAHQHDALIGRACDECDMMALFHRMVELHIVFIFDFLDRQHMLSRCRLDLEGLEQATAAR